MSRQPRRTNGDILNEELQVTKPPPPLSFPWLVISHGQDYEKQSFFNIYENFYYTKVIPDMFCKQIILCYRGWLLLKDVDTDELSFFNVSTTEKLPLPIVEFSSNLCNYYFILSAVPIDPHCRLIILNEEGYYLSWKPDDNEFARIDTIGEENIHFWSVVNFEGKIYGLKDRFILVTIEFPDLNLEIKQVIEDPIVHELPARSNCFLIESCGELLFVYKAYLDKPSSILFFEVFRADLLEKTWVKIEDLDERAIFLGGSNSKPHGFSCSTSQTGIRGNCIYYYDMFTLNLHVFSLKDQCISTAMTCPIASSRYALLDWVWS